MSDSGVPAATVFTRRLLHFDINLVAVSSAVRADQLQDDLRSNHLVLAVAVHEAGYARYSTKPQEETLDWVWNAVEDQPTEHRVARAFPQAGRVQPYRC